MSVRSYEKEEKQAYVEDYRKSGETLAKYAREFENCNIMLQFSYFLIYIIKLL